MYKIRVESVDAQTLDVYHFNHTKAIWLTKKWNKPSCIRTGSLRFVVFNDIQWNSIIGVWMKILILASLMALIYRIIMNEWILKVSLRSERDHITIICLCIHNINGDDAKCIHNIFSTYKKGKKNNIRHSIVYTIILTTVIFQP